MSIFSDDFWTDSSLYDNIEDWEDNLEWKYTLLPIPTSEFLSCGTDFECENLNKFPQFYETTEITGQTSKYQIRYHDCMWSGRCVSHQDKTKCSNNNNNNNSSTSGGGVAKEQHMTPVNPITQQQAQAALNVGIQQQQTQQKFAINTTNSSQQQRPIPAGTSLLLNSRLNQQKRLACKMRIPTLSTADFLKERETHSIFLPPPRPDTPLSLDDDHPEFKHTIDLAACTMGSNRMCLESVSEAKIISMLKEHLEDTSTDSIQQAKADIRQLISARQHTESLTDVMNVIKSFDDFEELDNEEELDEHEEEDSAVDMDSESESGHMVSSSVILNGTGDGGTKSIIQQQPQQQQQHRQQQQQEHQQNVMHHSDHSYTRSKNGSVDLIGLGVQTPSDSEEEIDVVSVSDKNLPTNPSAKDRRALQTTVAHKISARIVKTPKGVKTIPPRRRISDAESSYSSLTSPAKSSASSSVSNYDYSSPAPVTYNSAGKYSASSQATATTASSSTASTSSSPRKRNISNAATKSNSTGNNSSKRYRGKNRRSSGKRQASDSDEAETIEKRNLHNDMERQRRIGLKNLFEQLKKEIPNIRDKERAPKVNILREAALLCHRYNREHEQIIALKKQQERLMARAKNLRLSLEARKGERDCKAN